MFFTSALLHPLCVLLLVNAAVGYCPFGWLKHQKTCYTVFPADPDVRSVNKASDVCKKHGGALMNLYTEELNNMATVLMKPLETDRTAIGLNDRDHEGDYRWGDGKKATFFNWALGQPGSKILDKDCVWMRKTGVWADALCNQQISRLINSACEKPVKEHIVVPRQKQKTCLKSKQSHHSLVWNVNRITNVHNEKRETEKGWSMMGCS